MVLLDSLRRCHRRQSISTTGLVFGLRMNSFGWVVWAKCVGGHIRIVVVIVAQVVGTAGYIDRVGRWRVSVLFILGAASFHASRV